MMNTVRDTFSSIGDRGSDIARSFGTGTAQFARRFGNGTADLARDIGPRRALIGLAVAAVAIGGTIFLMRYLRARRERDRAIAIEQEEDLVITRSVAPGERVGVGAGMTGAGVRSPY